MKNLIFKEFRLSIHPLFYLVSLFGILILIPNWVYFVAIAYILFITVPNVFTTNKAQNDITFSILLPVRKQDVVKARIFSIVWLEAVQLVVAAIFGYLNHIIYAKNNFLMDPNAAFIGFGLVMYGVFNLVFFPMHYKTAYKIGIPTIIATFAAVVFATGVELFVYFVPFANLAFDASDPAMVIWKAGAFIVGLIIFLVMTTSAYRISARRFERIDL